MGSSLSDDEEIRNIKEDIEKSGLPLEIEVGSTLREKGWRVFHQRYYLDPDENKSRFVDVVANRIKKTGSKRINRINQTLFIECKRSLDKPWVFYTVPNFEDIFMNALSVKFITEPELPHHIENALIARSHYFRDPKEAAIIHYEPFIGRGGGKIFTAVNQVLKALRYEVKEKIIPLIKKGPKGIIAFFYPVIVFDGNMYKGERLNGGKLEISPIDYVKHEVSYLDLEKGMEESYLIDVLKKEFLSDYLRLLDDEYEKILDSFH